MIGALFRETITEPRSAARRLIDMRLDPSVAWTAFALVMVLTSALALIVRLAFPIPKELLDQSPLLRLQDHTLVAGAIQAGFLICAAWAMAALGRRFGGVARFPQTLLLVTWMEFVLLVVQVLQILATLVVPPVATLVGLAGFGLFFMLLTVFTAEANRFSSLPAVFMGVLVSLLLAGLAIMGLFVFFGVITFPQPGA